MEHAMNEKMREKVNEGKLDESTYEELVEELGRLKEGAGAPLYEVAYAENVIVANSHRSDDARELSTRLAHFKTDDKIATKTKIVRAVKDNQYCASYDAALLFHKYHEIELNDDGELDKQYRPGSTMALNMWCDEMDGPLDMGDACMIIYTIINVCKFNKKRKSHADPEE